VSVGDRLPPRRRSDGASMSTRSGITFTLVPPWAMSSSSLLGDYAGPSGFSPSASSSMPRP
jgi:hypothetical protein